jgi:transcriptional antiterminator NusG
VDFNMEGLGGKEITLSAEAPRGARLDDSVRIRMQVFAEGQECGSMEFFANTMQSILILKTSIGHERAVVDGVAGKAKTGSDKGIFALLAPGKLDGYVFMEAMNTDLVRETCRGVRKAKGLVDGETKLSEIEHFLTPKPWCPVYPKGMSWSSSPDPSRARRPACRRSTRARKRLR